MADITIVSCIPKGNQVDLWYENKREEIDELSLSWSDGRMAYVGNLYIKGKAVGDYTAESTNKVEEWFPQFDWDKVWENY